MAASSFSNRLLDAEEIRARTVTVTPSTSYPSGGEPITPANCGLRSIVAVAPAVDTAGRVWSYDQTNGTLRAFRNAAGAGNLAEVAAAQDLSATSFQIVAFGPV